MAGKTTKVLGRALLCVALAAALCAPRFGLDLPANRHEQPVRMLASGPAPAVLAARSAPRLDHAAAFGLPFVLRAADGPASDRGSRLAAVLQPHPRSRDAVGVRAGRSPPAIS